MHWTERYLGTPYEDLGDAGCYELLRRIYSDQLGIELGPRPVTIHSPPAEIVKAFEEERKGWIEVDTPLAYDVVDIALLGRPHCGVVINSRQFIHARENTAVSVEFMEHPSWRRRVKGYYRHALLM